MMKNLLNLIACLTIITMVLGNGLKADNGGENFCFDADVPEAQDNLSAICLTAPTLFCPATYLGCPSDDLDPSNTGFPTALPGDADCPTPIVSYTDMVTTNTSCLKIVHRTWEATYPAGSASIKLHSTCQQTLYLEDDEIPTINNCPGDLVVDLSVNCDSTATWAVPTADDNCGILYFITTHYSGTSFPLGTTPVTYTANDHCGNVATCEFTVTVSGSCCATPTITCPSNATICPTSGAPAPSVTGTATGSGSSTSCPAPTISYTDTTISTGSCGDYVINREWTATSGSASVNCVQQITAVDNTIPVINNLPGNITLTGNGSNCSIPASWTAPTATDDCGLASLTSNYNIGDTFNEGATTINYTAIDNCGNTATASFTVTIVCICDTAPILTCPANFVGCVGSSSDPASTGTAIALPGSATCGTPALNYTDVTISSGPCAGAVVLERTWTATVSNNNSLTTSCVQSITLGDNAVPTLSNIPTDITVHGSGANCSVPVKWATPIINDDCGTTLSSNHTSGSAFPEGTTSVIFMAVDGCGNMATASFNVTVECAAGCVNPPNITCPTNFSQCAGGFIPTPSVSGLATATPASTICSTPYLYYSDFIVAFGTCVGAYTIERTWTALDLGSGLTSTCVQVIELGDGGAPVISGMPQNITLSGSGANCEAIATWTEPTATDDCSISNFTSDYASGTTFTQGSTTITYSAADFCGNVTTSSFSVTVQCAAPLCSTPPTISCPANFASCPGTGVPTPSVIGQATATPGSSDCGTPLVTYSDQLITNNNCSIGGTYNRTWVASDPSDPSLASTCIQTITLEDNSQPVMNNIPGNISLEGTGANCEAVATWTEPTVSDNCGLASFTSNFISGSNFTQGSTTVTYTAVDNCGNTTIGSFTVSVNCTTATCTTPPAITCPANYTACADGSVPGLNVTGYAFGMITGPNCSGTPYTTFSDVVISSGPCAGAQVIERTWTSTDPSNKLQSSCVQMISLVDNNPPVISNLPSNITVTGSGFGCQVPVTWATPTATDDCGVASLTSNIGSGITFTQGTTTITYTAVDNCGNETAASFTITVQCEGCTVPPSITCPPAYTACVNSSTDPSVSGTAVGAITGTNCTGAPYVSYMDATLSSGPCAGETVIERQWMANNPTNMLFSTCVQIITLQDNGNPTISNIPNNITVTGTGAGCQVPLTWNAPTATDDCGIASLTSNYASGTTFTEGTTTIVYTAVDHCGHTATASFTVTVECDICDTPPLLSCPSNVYECAGGNSSPSYTGVATATNATGCTGTPYVTYSDAITSSGPCAGAMTIDRTWIAYDPNTNMSTSCLQIISLGDATLPTLSNVPSNIVVSGNGNGCNVPVTWNAPTAFDNCGTPTITSTHVSGGYFSEGVTTVTYSATDACGNSVSQTFTVTVQCAGCNTPPVINCPTNYAACTGGGSSPSVCGYATAYNNGANCTTTPSITYSDATISSGPCAGAYVLQRTWIANDGSTGLNASCVQTISLGDNSDPVIHNMPTNLTVTGTGINCQAPVSWAAPIASDNCGNPTLTSNYSSGTIFTMGSTVVTYTAVDGCGNTTTATFIVTVQCAGCNTPPGITCPANYTACPGGSTSSSVCGAAIGYNNGANCYTTPTVTYSDNIISTGPCYGAQVINRTWHAYDSSTGLSSTCAQTIALEDNTPPVISNMPTNQTVYGTGAGCSVLVTWTEPTVTDNCTVLSSGCQFTNGGYFNAGTYIATYTAEDNCGNITTASFTITVVCESCTTPPVISCPPAYATCPFGDTSPSICGTATAYNTGTNCSGNPTITYTDVTVSTGPCAGEKVIQRTWTATDPGSGLTATCVQVITLKDDIAPVFSNTPANIIITGTGTGCTETVTWTAPNVSDNCGIDTYVCNYASGDAFPEGTTTVICTAVDFCDNETTTSFDVTINCETCSSTPIITCPDDYTACPNGSVPLPAVSGTATAFPGEAYCGTPVVTYTDVVISSGPCAGQQIIERTWLATDALDPALTATCIQTINLIDTTPPVITGCSPGIILMGTTGSGGGGGTGSGTGSGTPGGPGTGTGVCSAIATWTPPVATDDCGTTTLVAFDDMGNVITSGHTFVEGTNTVTYVATDACGNESTCSFDVIISCSAICDVEPIAVCPADVTVCVNGDITPTAIGEGGYVAYPICTDINVTHSDSLISTGACTGEAVIERTWNVMIEENAGYSASCVQMITIEDTAPTLVSCPADITVTGETTPVTWVAPTITDACGNAVLTSSHASGSTFPCGATTVTYTMTDICGNVQTCAFVVTVNCSAGASGFTNCPSNMTLACATGTGAVANWTPPTYNSGCTTCLTGAPITGFLYMGNFGGSHFYCSLNPATWPAAKVACESNGGFLADVNSEEENNFLADQLSISSAWIGLTDVNGEGNFEWCNGDPIEYTNWYPGQPNNYGGNQDYCEMLSNGQWNDQYNSYSLEYIMEIPCTTIDLISGPEPGSTLAPGTYTVTYGVNDPCGSTETCSFDITVEECAISTCATGGLISECAYINQCDFGTISNVSGDNGGYADYTNMCTTIEPGMYVPIEFHPGHCSKPHTIYWTCWIDFNQDGDFYDNYEFVAYGAGATSITGGITIPAGIPNGTCTMRVSAKLGGYATDPCGTFLYGETEDYCVTVINGTLVTDNGNSTSGRSRVRDNATELTTGGIANKVEEIPSDDEITLETLELNTEMIAEEKVVLDELEIKIYPNPVSNVMNINLEDVTTIREMKLVDQSGREVREFELIRKSRVDVSDLPGGMYMVRILRTDGTMTTEKVIIMH